MPAAAGFGRKASGLLVNERSAAPALPAFDRSLSLSGWLRRHRTYFGRIVLNLGSNENKAGTLDAEA